MDILQTITQEFDLQPTHVKNIVSLIDEGNTIPFIARYRKEMTGACDDQVLRSLFDRLTYLRNLEKRKEEVANAITEQGKMTDEIMVALAKAVTMTEVEDIYRPYKQKRKTRASVAIAKGLQPLADAILTQNKALDVRAEAEKYLSDEVKTVDEAIAGAQDIIAEIISDDAITRKKLRNFFFNHGNISSCYAKGKEEEDEKKTYGMYADYEEPVSEVKSHRVLALNRGEKEEFLKVSIKVDGEFAKRITAASFLKDGGESSKIVKAAA
ncbi:MAG: RNA-binding transcriptional accessory protein, partial [Clostridia bacterium]|nr:RNA-binding transcriptional accessory protein [Clostridia bacterium]